MSDQTPNPTNVRTKYRVEKAAFIMRMIQYSCIGFIFITEALALVVILFFDSSCNDASILCILLGNGISSMPFLTQFLVYSLLGDALAPLYRRLFRRLLLLCYPKLARQKLVAHFNKTNAQSLQASSDSEGRTLLSLQEWISFLVVMVPIIIKGVIYALGFGFITHTFKSLLSGAPVRSLITNAFIWGGICGFMMFAIDDVLMYHLGVRVNAREEIQVSNRRMTDSEKREIAIPMYQTPPANTRIVFTSDSPSALAVLATIILTISVLELVALVFFHRSESSVLGTFINGAAKTSQYLLFCTSYLLGLATLPHVNQSILRYVFRHKRPAIKEKIVAHLVATLLQPFGTGAVDLESPRSEPPNSISWPIWVAFASPFFIIDAIYTREPDSPLLAGAFQELFEELLYIAFCVIGVAVYNSAVILINIHDFYKKEAEIEIAIAMEKNRPENGLGSVSAMSSCFALVMYWYLTTPATFENNIVYNESKTLLSGFSSKERNL
ncbi:hypothetical protein C8J56DRAFT_1072968 [Mycena floridula]|nr:hypothetical protein C8J56DRAFT_1072968 [Mycena floridula]